MLILNQVRFLLDQLFAGKPKVRRVGFAIALGIRLNYLVPQAAHFFCFIPWCLILLLPNPMPQTLTSGRIKKTVTVGSCIMAGLRD